MTLLAKLSHTHRSQLAQSASVKIGRAITDEIAERLEYAGRKPKGWMDELHVEDGHKMRARLVHETLLRLPSQVTDSIAALLHFMEYKEGDDSLGYIDLNEASAKTNKGRVITLDDNEGKNKKHSGSHVPKRGK